MADQITERQLTLLHLLPQLEKDILQQYTSGVRQKEIAEKLGMTQPGVSYRIGRARKRLGFLEQYPSLDRDTTQTALERAGFEAAGAKALAVICETTCQSTAARETGWSQGRVRHYHWRAIETLQGTQDPELQQILHALEMVRDNPAILHEYPDRR